jgi:hypothetical protein
VVRSCVKALLRRRSRRSPLIETGAGSEEESPHEEPHVYPCPPLAAGFIAASRLVGFFDDRSAKDLVLRRPPPKRCVAGVNDHLKISPPSPVVKGFYRGDP